MRLPTARRYLKCRVDDGEGFFHKHAIIEFSRIPVFEDATQKTLPAL